MLHSGTAALKCKEMSVVFVQWFNSAELFYRADVHTRSRLNRMVTSRTLSVTLLRRRSVEAGRGVSVACNRRFFGWRWPQVLSLYLPTHQQTTMAFSLVTKFTRKCTLRSTTRSYRRKGSLRRRRCSTASTWARRPTFASLDVNWFSRRASFSGYPR